MQLQDFLTQYESQDKCQWSTETGHILTEMYWIAIYLNTLLPKAVELFEAKCSEEDFTKFFVEEDEAFARKRTEESKSD